MHHIVVIKTMMWMMYQGTGREDYLITARRGGELLDEALDHFEDLHHDVGFMWHISSGADYRITGNPKAKQTNLYMAALLASRYNINGRFIQAWNGPCKGWVIIDTMMNIPLLYWASRELDNPRFRYIAMSHADTVIRSHVRTDGSVNHIVSFDIETGEILENIAGQGYELGSSWSRGQAWALYGFTMSYLHTRNNKYLGVACRIADRFIERIPENYHIPVDFDQPYECAWEDSSAAAIAACGLLKLSECVHYESEKKNYKNTGEMLLNTLYDELSNWDDSVDYIIDNCSVAYHDKEHNFPMVYGD